MKKILFFLIAVLTVAAHSENAQYYNELGEKAYHAKNYSEALKHYKKAIELDPSYAQAYSNMGLAYERLDRYWEAFAANEEAVAVSKDPAVTAASYYNLGRYSEKSYHYVNAYMYYSNARAHRTHDTYEKSMARMKEKIGGDAVLGADVFEYGGKYIDADSRKPFTGTIRLPSVLWQDYYRGGEGMSPTPDDGFLTVENGIKNGPFKLYDDSYRRQGTFKNGLFDGPLTEYLAYNDSYRDFIYKDGKLHGQICDGDRCFDYDMGTLIKYTEIKWEMVGGDSVKVERIHEIVDGERNGTYRKLLNGVLACEAVFKDDNYIEGFCIKDGVKTPVETASETGARPRFYWESYLYLK